MSIILSDKILTGKSYEHLAALSSRYPSSHLLHRGALCAFQSLQKKAQKAGFTLEPASSFRDFSRQQLIWNGKYTGQRRVHDEQGHTLDVKQLEPWARCQAILAWSALPGGSRHHWGTEIDVYDPTLLPANRSLQLEPWEYQEGGYFAELAQWLNETAPQFDFYFPFNGCSSALKVAIEPWHISYLPIAELAQQQFSAETLFASWQGELIEGIDTLIAHRDALFESYFL